MALKIARNLRGQSNQGRRASAADFGSGAGRAAEGQAIGQAGALLADAGTQVREARLGAQTTLAGQTLKRQANELRDEIRDDTSLDPDEHEAEYAKRMHKLITEGRATIGNERHRAQFDITAENINESVRGQVAGNVHRRTLALAQDDHNQAVLNGIQAAVMEDDAIDVREAIVQLEEIERNAQAQGLTTNSTVRIEKMKQAIFEGRAERLGTEDPEALLEQLEDSKDAGFEGMDPTQRQKEISSTKAAIRSIKAAERAEKTYLIRAREDAKKQLWAEKGLEAHNLMVEGKMTPEWLNLHGQSISPAMQTIVKKSIEQNGGRLLAPAFNAAEYARVEALSDADLIKEDLNPEGLGDRYIPLVKKQAAARKGPTVKFISSRVNELLTKSPFDNWWNGISEDDHGRFRRKVMRRVGDKTDVREPELEQIMLEEKVQYLRNVQPSAALRLEVKGFETHINSEGVRVDDKGVEVGIPIPGRGGLFGATEFIPEDILQDIFNGLEAIGVEPTQELIMDAYGTTLQEHETTQRLRRENAVRNVQEASEAQAK